ncbi:hypothetical protein SDRG_03252 [Saprolegnia diclina VS20]|uniref:Uncharacterized protein n=1 Tax=Saprolegnia diclina (strain VS20) TaxID=1156394 RepID=T0S409_SAPDV|nr:hypothetical protein SDRG_03252 [Saprolegnia diclina VS20]EQC39833.1 hypothetical protein SDRG_03252 [Saprolegnia diclina VS20]|eukprot:XP_008607105.1 hypothetical protein SDRG_03252 [Saprolegnia diclina VS20]
MDLHLAASYPSALSKTERRAVLSKAHLVPFKTHFRLTNDTSVASLLPYFCCHFLTAHCEDVDVSCPISDVRVETRVIMVHIEVLTRRASRVQFGSTEPLDISISESLQFAKTKLRTRSEGYNVRDEMWEAMIKLSGIRNQHNERNDVIKITADSSRK